MKLLLLLLCGCLSAPALFSQPDDCIYSDFIQAHSLREKALISTCLWNRYIRNDLDSLRINARVLLLEAGPSDDAYAIAVGKRSLGSYLIRSGKPVQGIAYLREAADYFLKSGDYVLLTETYNEIGNGYLFKGEPAEAIKWFERSLESGKYSSDPTSFFLAEINYAQALLKLGRIHEAQKRALHYVEEAEKRSKKEAAANGYAILGSIAARSGKKDEALTLYLKSAELNLEVGSVVQASNAYTNLAIAHFGAEDFIGAERDFLKALDLRLDARNAQLVSEAYYNLGEFYRERKDPEASLSAYRDARDVARENALPLEEADALEALSLLFEQQGKTQLALETERELNALLRERGKNEVREESIGTDLDYQLKADLLKSGFLKRERMIREQVARSQRDNTILTICVILAISLSAVGVFLLRRKNLN